MHDKSLAKIGGGGWMGSRHPSGLACTERGTGNVLASRAAAHKGMRAARPLTGWRRLAAFG